MARWRAWLATAAAVSLPLTALAALNPIGTIPASAATAGPPTCTSAPHLATTFFSGDVAPMNAWSEWNWEQELNQLKQACITSVVLDDSATNQAGSGTMTTIFGPGSSTDVVANLMTAATAVGGIGVYLGLQTEDGWGDTLTTSWASGAASRSAQVAQELLADVGHPADLLGWYLSPEPGSSTLQTASQQSIFASYVRSASSRLHQLLPGGKVLLAPTFDTWIPQSSFSSMMQTLAQGTGIDALALQDQTGAPFEHVGPGDVAPWFAAAEQAIDAANAATGASVQLWSDIEVFREADWTPANTSEVVAAIKAESPYVSQLGAFSLVQYMSLSGWFPAYYAPYETYAQTGHLPTYKPNAPKPVAGVSGFDGYVAWSAVNDNAPAGYQGTINEYLVYRSQNGGSPQLMTTIRAGSPPVCHTGDQYCFIDPQLQSGSRYSYTIDSVNAVGNQASATVSASLPALSGASDLALGDPYQLSPAPAANYPDRGGALVDGVVGPVNDQDPAWMGWAGDSPTMIIDLGRAQPVTSVQTSWLQQLGPGVVLPSSVSFAASTDGTTWTSLPIADAPNVTSTDQVVTFGTLASPAVQARYIRITATNPGGWVFTSEATVRGPDPLGGRTSYVDSRPSSPSYPDRGQLTDSTPGQPGNPYDPQWAGWWNANGLTLSDPLATSRTVSAVTVDALNLPSWGIFPPTGLSVSTSTDGVTYTPDKVILSGPDAAGQITARLATPTSARYVRIGIQATADTWTMLGQLSISS